MSVTLTARPTVFPRRVEFILLSGPDCLFSSFFAIKPPRWLTVRVVQTSHHDPGFAASVIFVIPPLIKFLLFKGELAERPAEFPFK